MGGLGAPELLIILAVVLLLFGGAKLPKLARSLGEAQREFKKGVRDGEQAEALDPPEDRPKS
jgi:sec-independent protein translocase protein TatA